MTRVPVPDAAAGMAASLRAGLAAVPEGRGVMLVLADLPDLSADDLVAVLARWRDRPGRILRGADSDGQPGHPVCFPADLRGALERVTGDQGAREVLSAHAARVELVRLPGRHATTDLDTPEDWARWRAARTGGS